MTSEEHGKKDPRRSITKRRREVPAVVDLMNLCMTVTEDGRIDDQEVAELSAWLQENEDLELPAKDYLRRTVEKIIADGRVDPDERRELFLAIEKVLPPELQGIAHASRRQVEEKGKGRAGAGREEERERARDRREGNRHVGHWDFMVAGVRHEGRPAVISRYARPGVEVRLIRDQENAFSGNAVRIRTGDDQEIGMVPEEDARTLAPYLDRVHPYSASIKKVLSGGRTPIPVVVVDVYRHDASVPGASRAAVVARFEAAPRSDRARVSRASRRPGQERKTDLKPWAIGFAIIAALLLLLLLLP
jgi:HIRAN domain